MGKKSFKKLFGLLLAVLMLGNTLSAGFPALAVNQKSETAVPEESALPADADRQRTVSENSAETENESVPEDTDETVEETETVHVEDTEPAAETEEVRGEETVTFTVPVSEDELPDADALFAGYVEKTFYADSDTGASTFGNLGASRLQGEYNKKIYAVLKEKIGAVAAGNPTGTEFVLTFEGIGLKPLTWTAAELGVSAITQDNIKEAVNRKFGETISTRNILDYLLVDCPYELYWFDKTKGLNTSYSMSYSSAQVTISEITISFAVASEYQSGGNPYQVSAGIAAVGQAVTRAAGIVEKYRGKSDYEKLEGYRREICALVSYNDSAADDSTHTAYGNPWQLIWVFDGDTSTNVVCEGYSKAFQYLCDMSAFTDAVCYTVTGTMSGGTGAGPHMWNIIRTGGKSYLVDVTNCDSGSIGADDLLFLAGADGSVAGGYTVTCNNQDIKYTYDTDQEALYDSDILTLSATKYVPKTTLTVEVNPVTVTYGDAVSASVLSGTAAGSDGTEVPGSFSWASDVVSYGNAGTKTLKAVFRPTDTLRYDSAEAEVTVTVNKKAITVRAEAAGKIYGEADPELGYQVNEGGLVSGDSLTGVLSRVPGENVKAGGYEIGQGTLNHSNYEITFVSAVFTIRPADYTVNEVSLQNVLSGIGTFTEPSFTGVNDETVSGTLTYSYGADSGISYAQMTNVLKDLPLNTEGSLSYTFTPDEHGNYAGEKTGAISFIVKDVGFFAGGSAAGVGNGVTVKENPVYGDTWEEIVRIGNITAQAGNAADASPRYTLNVSGKPDAGSQTFRVLYSGTIGTKTYTDVVVCEGTVEVAKRTVAVSAGTCKVSKVYDGTVSAGAIAGSLAVTGILNEDTDITVTAVPAAYENPNVGGQSSVEAVLTLQGDSKGNYQLASGTLSVPCEITPQIIVPEVEITGSYQYTGDAVIPAVTVKNGEMLLKESEYAIIVSDNINAGNARVEIRAKEGSNYTWANPVVRTFVIEKVSYAKETSVSLAVRYGGSVAYDLAAILPGGAKLGELALSDSDSVLTEVPELNGTVLSCSAVDSQANAGKTAEITIPVTESTNYLPFEVMVLLTVSDKLPQTAFRFGSSVQNKSYGSGDFIFAAEGMAEGSKVTYTSSDAETATVDNTGKVHIIKPGTVVITAVAAETGDYHKGTAFYTLNITPAVLTWDIADLSAADRKENVKADSKTATLFGSLNVSGILESDMADVEFICPAGQLNGVYGKVETGVQKVTLTWADEASPVVLQGTKASYYMLPSALPQITGVITEVRDLPVVPQELNQDRYKLTSENGISEVPEALEKNEKLNTPDKITKWMKQEILRIEQNGVPAANMVVYDLTLMVKSADSTGKWEAVTAENFPKGGITVTLPYPDGTGKDTHEFTVVHMITAGSDAGETESLTVTKTVNGIQFKVFSLSPVAVGWKAVKQDVPGDTDRPDAGGDKNTDKDTEKDTDNNTDNKDSGNDNGGNSGTGNENGNGSGSSGYSGNQNGSNGRNAANTANVSGAESSRSMASARTGDESPVMLYAFFFLAAGSLLVGCAVRRKREIGN